MDSSPGPGRSSTRAGIRLEHVSKVYDLPTGSGGPRVIAADDLSLDIPAGEVFGVVGPNGAGKTTTLKMICGLLVPTAGRILVGGIDVESKPEEAQGRLGYLADFFSLYDDLKVWEYLDYFGRAYKLPAAAVRERVNDVIVLMALESKRTALIGGLSRGMKQRLGIARAIVHDPPILVLDEPAAGLDPKSRTDFKHLITELRLQGKTVLITSHLLADLEEMCTLFAIIERGRLVRAGRLDQIVREAGGIRRVRIKLAQPGFPLEEWLAAQAGVSRVIADPVRADCHFAGDDRALAVLVTAAVTAGAPVCGVEELTERLETVVSRLSTEEVM
jgi:ABC-2 type transport system ATP-binding protein